MANVADIVEIAGSLEKSPIVVVRDRCVAVRNRNASCMRCIDACPADAIEVYANEIHLSASACVSCGACAAACPTEALVAIKPSHADLLSSAAQAAVCNDGRAVIACARRAARREADPGLFAEVPCLAFVGEGLIVQLAAYGAGEVVLVDGVCPTCKHGACDQGIDRMVAYANELLGQTESPARVSRMAAFPDEVLASEAPASYGANRREFFSEAVAAAKESALSAAKAAIRQELGIKEEADAIGERLRVGVGGVLPQIDAPRHAGILDALDRLGWMPDGNVETRLFGSVDIDVGKCNACGMCAVFCPTGALRRDDAESPDDPLHSLEFQACDCVQCGLCADVCWKKALKLGDRVDAAELFDFEPRAFVLP